MGGAGVHGEEDRERGSGGERSRLHSCKILFKTAASVYPPVLDVSSCWKVPTSWNSASRVRHAISQSRRRWRRSFGASVRATSAKSTKRSWVMRWGTCARSSNSTPLTFLTSAKTDTTDATVRWWERRMESNTTGALSVLCCSRSRSTPLSVCILFSRSLQFIAASCVRENVCNSSKMRKNHVLYFLNVKKPKTKASLYTNFGEYSVSSTLNYRVLM